MKITFRYRHLAALLLFAPGAAAQGHSPTTDAPTFTAQGAFVAIAVSDLDESVRWYESNLGLHLLKRGNAPRLLAETVVLGGHNIFVELIHHDGKRLPRVDNEASVPRLLKAGVILGQKDFDAVATYLQKRGIEAGMFEDKEMGVRSFLFSDNDGNLIQFFTSNQGYSVRIVRPGSLSGTTISRQLTCCVLQYVLALGSRRFYCLCSR